MAKKEGRYYLEYIGWKEAAGIYGKEFTEPIITELLARRRHHGQLPKMTIKLNQNEIQISQEVPKKSGSKQEKTKYPAIPTKDITYVTRGSYPDNDVVACIFLGYNPYTKCAVHVHVYRFDSSDTASVFVDHLNAITDRPDYRERVAAIEKDLSELGHIRKRSQAGHLIPGRHSTGSDGMSYGSRSPMSSESLSPKYPTVEEALKQRQDIVIQKSPKPAPVDPQNVKKVFTSLQEEFHFKVNLQEAPMLLPPKDYDTIVRRHGKLDYRDEIKASQQQYSIMGANSIFTQPNAQTNGEAIAEDGSENGKSDNYSDKQVHNDAKLNGHGEKAKKSYGLMRSSSDTFVQGPTSSLARQNSFASSEVSANSDEYFGDNLYKGFKPKMHKRSASKEDNSKIEETSPMAMWSPSFSFGQNGMRTLHTHLEEETDPLNRTAPAGSLLQPATSPVEANDYYTITPRVAAGNHSHVRRSHSQNHHKSRHRTKT